jgi:hypothetical protein
MNPKPLCFVLMPFGKKPDGSGRLVDFDAVYGDLIAPAIADVEDDGRHHSKAHVRVSDPVRVSGAGMLC